MSRLPIRIRLTLPFALAMALVLAALGTFVYLRVGSLLLRSADQSLNAQAAQTTLRIEKGRALIDKDGETGISFAQLIAPDGVVVSSDPAGVPALLDPVTARRVVLGSQTRATVAIPGHPGRWRLLAVPEGGKETRVLVLGSSLDTRDESLEHLRRELLLGSPLALVLAILAGYVLAGAALRPVEAMRRKAGAISAATPGSRLPVPPARDEISRLAETLNQMLDRLEIAFEHERRFVADASHELRTPLALLRTELELALRHPRSHAELEEAIRSAAEETDRLTALAADLLLIASSDQSSLALNVEDTPADDLLAGVAARFDARAGGLGRTLEVSGSGDLVVAADPKRVEQALGNLVENALVHGSGRVTLSAKEVSCTVELHVADEGPGFPDGFASRAFDRFSRADEARPRRGSGLGLAIVQTIALAHGGSAGVSALPGTSDVWMALPAGRRETLADRHFESLPSAD
ncbi:MAG TPA: ATP-binding protein [Gaiellaceae bacterium]|jgi:signal transduction histidine kinase|nr:ATP-binding protein [Gaiellaceae bacterium]